MPESITLHFSDAAASEVHSALAARSEKAADRETYYYPNNAAYLLLISAYTDYDIEYDEEEKTRIEACLGRRPRFSLSIELRRSQQDFACDAAAALVLELSARHNFVVDDSHQLWTRSEIRAGDVLQAYRSRNEPNQAPEPMPLKRHGSS